MDDPEVIYTVDNVAYLPLPNRVEVIFSRDMAPAELTRSAFMIALHDDGSIVLASNRRRGSEVPGGHVEEGESLMDCAIRETLEETGCEVDGVFPIGYLRMISEGEAPEGWAYPHPLGYQQFFAGQIIDIGPFTPNDECDEPVRCWGGHHRHDVNLFWDEAVRRLKGG